MEAIPLELAFSRFGADISGRQRVLSATANDGSLVLVCQSNGFSRPVPGVLRYSSKLSLSTATRSQVDTLRSGLDAGFAGQTPVRLIIQTPVASRTSTRVHIRADLVGSLTAYDGDAYSVDFVRIPVEQPEPAPRIRRKR